MKKVIILSLIAMIVSACAIRSDKQIQPIVKTTKPQVTATAKRPVYPKVNSSISYGSVPSFEELAKQKGLPIGGGIKKGQVIVIPKAIEFYIMEQRAAGGVPNLSIRSIARGQTLADAKRAVSVVRTPIVKGRIPVIPISDSLRNTECRIILDSVDEPLTLRPSEKGIHRYAFFHVINAAKYHYQWQQRELTNLDQEIHRLSKKLDVIQTSLSRNRAYQNNQCMTVKRRPISKPPKRIPPELIRVNAHGACINVLGSRFNQEQVIEALESNGRWDMTKDYQKWVLGKKMQCAAGVTISNFESFKTRAIDRFLPQLGKDWFRHSIMKDIQSCAYGVKRACDDGYDRWLANKQAIIAEPAKLKSQCDLDKQKLDRFDQKALRELQAKRIELLQKRDQAYAKQQHYTYETILPFTDKRTYCPL